MLCARIYICIQTYFMQIVKKHAFLYIYIYTYVELQKKLIFFLSVCTCVFFYTFFQGRHRTHIRYRGMPYLHCFLHSTVG